MWVAGWEIVKLISEEKIKNKQLVTAYMGNKHVDMIITSDKTDINLIDKNNESIHYGLAWLLQPKEDIQFLIYLNEE